MKYIAFDSSTKALTLALAEGDLDFSGTGATDTATATVTGTTSTASSTAMSVRASTTTLGKRQHGQTLAPAVETILDQVDWKMSDVDAIVVGNGPGSYTGLRIGVTLAKVWANSKKLPLYSVSSLALMANAAARDSDFVIPLMDARRGTAYLGFYGFKENRLTALAKDRHAQFDTWLAQHRLAIPQGSKLTMVGTDIDEFTKMVHQQLNGVEIEVISDFKAYPHAVEAFRGVPLTLVEEPTLLTPNYAHDTLAEREWQVKTQEEAPISEDLIDFK